MARERDTTEREFKMLKEIHGGMTIEQAAERLGVSTTTVDNWRDDLREGVEFLDSYIKVDFGRRNRMDTTVHPIFLPANSSEVYALLMILQEYAKDHPREPRGMMAEKLAGKVHHQLTLYARDLVDKNLVESGVGVPDDVCPNFEKDNHGGCEPIYLTMLEKSVARVSIVYDVGDGESACVRGKLSCRCPVQPGCVRVEPLGAADESEDLEIEYDKIVFVELLGK
ncbi:helix-turn-helix domain-containing protein [Paratractidigestivibacter sp.]|uniref:helix-turn-helix domain-containing protein n=1 Tax=Paratractidigestivibacter sp. TaxID=2847316 RepID=UPI002AC91FFC|nr:helix-turn-helix domain-containing protein [Paratractidigestivibacter sp.]